MLLFSCFFLKWFWFRLFFLVCYSSFPGQELETTLKTKKTNQKLILRDNLKIVMCLVFWVFTVVLVVVHCFRCFFLGFLQWFSWSGYKLPGQPLQGTPSSIQFQRIWWLRASSTIEAQWCSMVLNGAQWFSMVLNGSQWFSILLDALLCHDALKA